MSARIANLSSLHPFANEALGALGTRAGEYGLAASVLELTHLRVSQINAALDLAEHVTRNG